MTTHNAREFDRSAVTALAPVVALVPFWLIAMTLLWLPLYMFTDVPWWWVPVGWLALGVVLFFPPIQVAILSSVLGARRLTTREAHIVEPLWRSVGQAAGFRPGKYRIRVIDSPELNGFASGGHLIVLTTFAIHELSPAELSGVLAHEVSHHIGFHTVALTVSQWLAVPVLALARVGFWLKDVARAATRSFAPDSSIARGIGGFVALILNGIAWVFLLGLQGTAAINNMVSKQSEFDADQRAVRMGYGPELTSALRAVVRYGGGQRAIGWRQRISTSHPAARTRVAHIESLMQVPAIRDANRRERSYDLGPGTRRVARRPPEAKPTPRAR